MFKSNHSRSFIIHLFKCNYYYNKTSLNCLLSTSSLSTIYKWKTLNRDNIQSNAQTRHLNCLKRSNNVLDERIGSNVHYRRQSTTPTTENDEPRRIDPLDLTFHNTKQAYKSKKTSELLRAVFVLYLSQFDSLVFNHAKLTELGRRVMGKRLFHKLMEATFYGQFVAGKNEVTIKPVLDHLRSFGVKSILDYSAEEDMPESNEKKNDKRKSKKDDETGKKYKYDEVLARPKEHRPVARTYFYRNEANCEKNMDIFLRCIDAVAGATYGTGFAAIKLTALGRPELLLQVSEVIARCRNYFEEITGKQRMVFGDVSPSEFQKQLDQRFMINTDNEDIAKFIKRMDYDQRGLMNIFSWNGLIEMQTLVNDLFLVPNLKTGRMEPIISALTQEEEEMFRNMMRRLHTIACVATEKDVRILVDAEQTYFQPAINRITLELMRKYNKEKAIIFNTYQCYLKNAYDTCQIDVELSRRQNFYFGAKLVRGAYQEQERLRASQLGYEDPINPDYDATTAMYEKNLDFFMKKIIETGLENKKFAIMVASHNEDTVRYTIKRMQELGISPEHRVICFGQLYGMSDHISFNLGQSGFSVYKYVPYGPIDEVLPYLSRRALENHGVLVNAKKERNLIASEVWRRITTGQFIHRPIGNYRPI